MRAQPGLFTWATVVSYLMGKKAAYSWAILLVIGFLALDIALPLGVAAGVPYAVAVMIALRTSDKRFIIGITVLTGFLTVLGFAVPPNGHDFSGPLFSTNAGHVMWQVLANRILAIFVISGAGLFSVYSINTRENFTRRAVEIEQARHRQIQEVNVQLVRASEARSEFLGQISHELRTPLTSLTTFAHILDSKSNSLPKERVREHAEVISRSARRLEVLIDDLLDASGAETGAFKLDLAITNIPDIVSTAAAEFTAQARTRDQEIVVEIDVPQDSEYHALADPMRISQVVTNLVSNASKYSWPGSEITVFCGLESNKYIVKVVDHGEGISRDDLQRIFTPFFRVDNVNVRATPGAGLGLTIARSIIELHDGSISIESVLGVGTTVSFIIPAFPNE